MQSDCAENEEDVANGTEIRSEDQSEDDDNDDCSGWEDEVQLYRMFIVERVQYSYISAALQSWKVLDREDDEELMNHYIYRTTRMRTNGLVDVILRKGEENYKKFLQVLGIFYPDVYTEITRSKPPDASDIPLLKIQSGHSDNIELVQCLMQALESMKQKAFDTVQRLKKVDKIAEDRKQENERQKQKIENLTLKVNCYETIENEMASLRSEVDRLKNENYTICMRMIDVNEENRQLRVSNMNIKNENDKLTLDLMRVKRTMEMETSKSVRLRLKLDTGPSEKDVMHMQREIAELKLKLAKAHNNNKEVKDEDMRVQILRKDKEEALEMYGDAVEELHKLRETCSNAEALRDKYLDEKEQLVLTCSALQSDCDMYKMRRDSMWQQLQEVEKEREMLMKERNEAQLKTKTCMEEKARYRSQIRDLERKYDENAQKFLESERELIRLRRPRACTSEVDKYNELPKMTSYPNSSSAPTTSSLRSEPASELGQFRPRAYITKYFNKYVSKSNVVLTESSSPNCASALGGIFPEIELASDYPSPDKTRRRRIGHHRNRGATMIESSVCESISSNSSNEAD